MCEANHPPGAGVVPSRGTRRQAVEYGPAVALSRRRIRRAAARAPRWCVFAHGLVRGGFRPRRSLRDQAAERVQTGASESLLLGRTPRWSPGGGPLPPAVVSESTPPRNLCRTTVTVLSR